MNATIEIVPSVLDRIRSTHPVMAALPSEARC